MGKPLKQLSMGPEEFFVYVTNTIAPLPPWEEIKSFRGRGPPQWNTGAMAWLRDSPQGQQFTQCVTTAGEAKGRAIHWLNKYSWWLDKRRKQDGRDIRGDRA